SQGSVRAIGPRRSASGSEIRFAACSAPRCHRPMSRCHARRGVLGSAPPFELTHQSPTTTGTERAREVCAHVHARSAPTGGALDSLQQEPTRLRLCPSGLPRLHGGCRGPLYERDPTSTRGLRSATPSADLRQRTLNRPRFPAAPMWVEALG